MNDIKKRKKGRVFNYYKDFEGNIIKYRINSDYDTPEKREKASKLKDKRCKIFTCIKYDNCDRIKIKGNNVKCKNYGCGLYNLANAWHLLNDKM